MHVKLQLLPSPQVQVPFEHSPEQLSLPPSQVTWHGPESQVNEQSPPSAQMQSPFAQLALHSEPGAQSIRHGALRQVKSQRLSGPHAHSPLAHSATHDLLSPSQIALHVPLSQGIAQL